MCEYVGALSPDGAEPGAAPWQIELAKQQQALASVLRTCPCDGAAVVATLADFMSDSQSRLEAQLSELEWEISEAQSQSVDAVEPAATAEAELPPTALTAVSFLERLQSQRRAVCKLQAGARGRLHRRHCRCWAASRAAATLRLQSHARRFAAHRVAGALREAVRREHARRLGALHSARRLQRAWRWRRRVRWWRDRWLRRLAAEGAATLVTWPNELQQSLGRPSAAAASEFTPSASYSEAPRLRERREAEHAAARALQRWARGGRTRGWRRRWDDATRRLQAAWRGWGARTRQLWWRRALRRLRAKRGEELRWRALRATSRRLAPLREHAVMLVAKTEEERDAVKLEVAAERGRLEEAYGAWAKGSRSQLLARKLHQERHALRLCPCLCRDEDEMDPMRGAVISLDLRCRTQDWVPQMDPATSGTYWFNLRTGESTLEQDSRHLVNAFHRT